MHTLKPYLTFFIFSSNYMHRITISPQFSTAIITIIHKDQLKMTWHEKKQTWKSLTFPNPYLCFSTVISWLNKEMLSHLPHNCLVYVVRSSLLQQLSHLAFTLGRRDFGRAAGYRFCAKALSLSCFVSLWLLRELIWVALERITEHLRVAGTSRCHLVTHPLTAQTTSKPNATSKADQVAQGHTWLRLECLQGWRLHSSGSWSTHCSLDAVGHLNTSHHAAIQQWASRSLCTGQHSASPWSFRGFAFLLVAHEKAFTLSAGVTSKDNVNCWYFHLHLCSSWFLKIFPASLSEHLSYFDIPFTQEKEKRTLQIPIKPQTLEL